MIGWTPIGLRLNFWTRATDVTVPTAFVLFFQKDGTESVGYIGGEIEARSRISLLEEMPICMCHGDTVFLRELATAPITPQGHIDLYRLSTWPMIRVLFQQAFERPLNRGRSIFVGRTPGCVQW